MNPPQQYGTSYLSIAEVPLMEGQALLKYITLSNSSGRFNDKII